MRGFSWFPTIGACIGGWASVWFEASVAVWPEPIVAACISTSATVRPLTLVNFALRECEKVCHCQVWLTGCFHEDGLGDTLDGFGGGWSRAQILRIMKATHTAPQGHFLWSRAKI